MGQRAAPVPLNFDEDDDEDDDLVSSEDENGVEKEDDIARNPLPFFWVFFSPQYVTLSHSRQPQLLPKFEIKNNTELILTVEESMPEDLKKSTAEKCAGWSTYWDSAFTRVKAHAHVASIPLPKAVKEKYEIVNNSKTELIIRWQVLDAVVETTGEFSVPVPQ